MSFRDRLSVPPWSDRVAAAWGFAEATTFFIIPDVFLTFVALRSRRLALRALVWALAGAITGGALMYWFAMTNPEAAHALLTRIPAIDEPLIDQVSSQRARLGRIAVVIGPSKGIPYKIYAVEEGTLRGGLLVFVLISIFARGARFLIVTLLGRLGAIAIDRLAKSKADTMKLAVHLGVWTAVYVTYFAVMGG